MNDGLEQFSNKIQKEVIIIDGKPIVQIPVELMALDLIVLSHDDEVHFLAENVDNNGLNLRIVIKKEV